MPSAEELPLGQAWRRSLGWLVVGGWLVACGPPRAEHPLEARGRRVVVACSEGLPTASERHDFSALICQQYCPKASARERLVGCYRVSSGSEQRQRMAPGAEALMACEFTEAR